MLKIILTAKFLVDIENMFKIQHGWFDPNSFTIQDVIGAELYSFLSVKKLLRTNTCPIPRTIINMVCPMNQ
jgi:hypothetical protein